MNNPRNNSKNLGLMICFHGRYDLGDSHEFDHRNYAGWAQLEAAIVAKHAPAVILPLYLYNHGGLSISTESFVGRAQHAAWDSGKVGYIVAPAATVREKLNVKHITSKVRAAVKQALIDEVKSYDSYLIGE